MTQGHVHGPSSVNVFLGPAASPRTGLHLTPLFTYLSIPTSQPKTPARSSRLPGDVRPPDSTPACRGHLCYASSTDTTATESPHNLRFRDECLTLTSLTPAAFQLRSWMLLRKFHYRFSCCDVDTAKQSLFCIPSKSPWRDTWPCHGPASPPGTPTYGALSEEKR